MEAKALDYWREKSAMDGMTLAGRQKIRCKFWWYESADGYSNHRVVIRGDRSQRIDAQFPTMLDIKNSGIIKQLAKLEKGEELEIGLLTPKNHGLPILEYLKVSATGREHLVHHMFELAQK